MERAVFTIPPEKAWRALLLSLRIMAAIGVNGWPSASRMRLPSEDWAGKTELKTSHGAELAPRHLFVFHRSVWQVSCRGRLGGFSEFCEPLRFRAGARLLKRRRRGLWRRVSHGLQSQQGLRLSRLGQAAARGDGLVLSVQRARVPIVVGASVILNAYVLGRWLPENLCQAGAHGTAIMLPVFVNFAAHKFVTFRNH